MNPKKESSGSQFYIVQGKVYTAEEITSLEEQIAQGKKGNAVGNYIRNNPEMLAKFQAMQANAEFAKMDSVAAEIEAKLVAEMGKAAFKFALSDSIKKVYQTIGGTPFLDNEYTVFGEVVEGLNVIDSIAKVNANGASRPMKDIKMTVEVRKK
jgi:peptidyl-prolyl cis-trans isomerase B (cyclophilin B)